MEALAPLREEWRHRRQCGGGRRMPQGGALQVEEEEENNKEEEEGKVDKEEEDAEPLPAGEPAAPNRRWKPHSQERRSSEILKRTTTT